MAEQAIRDVQVRGKRVGDSTLDDRIDAVFNRWANDPNHSSRHKWRLSNNCKTEADNLIEAAKKLP